MSRLELERAIIELLTRVRQLPAAGKSLLEIGCGSGGNLLQFLRLGYRPECLVGSELLEDRARSARHALPEALAIYSGDALDLPLTEQSFDVVFQSLVFSSILDAEYRRELAEKMWGLARAGGGILWYDFIFDNPANPDVAGMPLREVRRLFPGRGIVARRLTLAPPISRRVAAWSPMFYTALASVPFLRTHMLCWIGKEN